MTRAISRVRLWLGVPIGILICGGLLWGLGGHFYQDYRFAYHAHSALAVVDKKYITTSSHRKGGVTHTPHVAYHYSVGDVVRNHSASVQQATYDQVQPGGTLSVLYLTDEMGISRIDNPAERQSVRVDGWIWIVVNLIAVTATVWLTIYFAKRNGVERFLRTQGMATLGLVTEVKLEWVGKRKDRAKYTLEFMFRDAQGGEIFGETWALRPNEESRWKASDPIRVYFDPTNANRFTVDLKPVAPV